MLGHVCSGAIPARQIDELVARSFCELECNDELDWDSFMQWLGTDGQQPTPGSPPREPSARGQDLVGDTAGCCAPTVEAPPPAAAAAEAVAATAAAEGGEARAVVSTEGPPVHAPAGGEATPSPMPPAHVDPARESGLYGGVGDPLRALSVQFFAGEFVRIAAALRPEIADDELTIRDIEPGLRAISGGRCPRDGREGCAYVDVAPDPDAGLARHMLSYTWGYRVLDIASVLRQYCASRGLHPASVRVWMCFACINQHRVQETEAVPFEEFQAEFGARVRSVDHVLAMMSPWQRPEYTDRVWCVYEFFTAMQAKKKLSILMPETQQASFRAAVEGDICLQSIVDALGGIRIQDASASVPGDKARILMSIDPGAHGGHGCGTLALEQVNHEVRRRLQSWFLDTAVGYLEAPSDSAEPPPVRRTVSAAQLLLRLPTSSTRSATRPDDRARRLLGRLLQGRPSEAGRSATLSAQERARVLLTLGESYLNVPLSRDRRDEARKHFSEALEIVKNESVDTQTHADALHGLGHSYAVEANLPLAEWHFLEAKQLLEEDAASANGFRHAELARNLASLYLEHSQHDNAVRCYLEAQHIFERLGRTQHPEYGSVLLGLALTMKKVGDVAAWGQYLQEAHAVFEATALFWHPDYTEVRKGLQEVARQRLPG